MDTEVSCGEDLADCDTLLDALIIVEVLSKGTKNYDRGKHSKSTGAFRHFASTLIVAQTRPYVEHRVRSEDRSRTMREFTDLADVLKLIALER